MPKILMVINLLKGVRVHKRISREWSNQWNPFNSAKVLLWREHFEGCAELKLLPPVTVGIDLSNRCNFNCIWCLPKGTLVLTENWEYEFIENLKTGDVIIGFGNRDAKNKHTSLIKTKIKNVMFHNAPLLIEIMTEEGIIRTTPKHKIWDSRGRWKLSKNFRKNDYITSFGYSNYQDRNNAHKKGWLCGISDGDGCFWNAKDKRHKNPKNRCQFRLAVNDVEILENFQRWAKAANYELYKGNRVGDGYGGKRKMEAIFLTKSKIASKFRKWLHRDDGDVNYFYGWLGGIFDAEGSFSNNILRISQQNKLIRNKIKYCLSLCGFQFVEEKRGFRLFGGQKEFIKFFNLCKPVVSRKKDKLLNSKARTKVKVIDVKKVNYNSVVYDIETTCHNFIANGVKVHNCNAFEIMQGSQAMLSKDHILRLADFCAEWGVKSVCAGGGGEPLTNPFAKDLYYRLKKNGIGCAPVTNGSLLNDEIIEAMASTSRWIGISMDAGCNSTYMKVKGISNPKIFDITCNNIAKLTKRVRELGTECDVGYKFLLHPLNALEIFEAAKLAKFLDVHDFQLRPVGWDNVLKTKNKTDIDFDNLFDEISSQIEDAMSLEDETFSVYGVRHKFQFNFQRKVEFKHCWASPISASVFGADGDYTICLDMRGKKDFVLCRHYPNPYEVLKHWNSPQHIKMIQAIDPAKCPRCTIGPYHEVVEQVFIKDRMCRDFL